MRGTTSKLGEKTLRACFVSPCTYEFLGAERSLLELVEMLAKMGVDCSVILPCKGPLFRELESRGIEVISMPFTWWGGLPRSYLAGWTTPSMIRTYLSGSSPMRRIVRTALHLLTVPLMAARMRLLRCDVVYTNTMTVCAGALAARLLRRPHAWHIREFGREDLGLVFDLGERLSMRLMDQLSSILIVNSQAVASKFMPIFGPRKVRLVYGSVEVDWENVKTKFPIPEGTNVRCVVVGSIQKSKGQEDAVLATSELLRLGLQPVLWIVGPTVDRQYERRLHRIVHDLGLERFVRFVGGMDNPFSVMLQADVVLICSRSEAFGRVTVEGMLARKPVIGTRSGGTSELIQEGINGLLYNPGDYRELARKISYLSSNPAEVQRMGQKGCEWAQTRFDQARFAREILGLLTQIVKSDSKRSTDQIASLVEYMTMTQTGEHIILQKAM